MARRRALILGAAGRDFHNFNTLFREDESVEVVAFTAAQIPDIDGRRYPAELAGPLYPGGIPIEPEAEMEALIRDLGVDEVWFSYSDVSHEQVMHLGSRAVAAGAHFGICSATRTMVESTRPVVAVTAVRTGVGKSQTTRYLCEILADLGRNAVVVRHPMPYGDLALQICQRFETREDLLRHRCTIEEREEYEPHIDRGNVVYAGVDYERILRRAEAEADVVLWDGGNNDTPFYRPDLHITLLDPLRPGHETSYYPGETNLRMADVLVVSKCGQASPEDLERIEESISRHNPGATVVRCDSRVRLDDAEAVRGRKVLVVEDGPTLTHGGMSYGAGVVAAREAGAAEIVDPSPWAVGSIRETFEKYPHARGILPAMGYGDAQIRDLRETIEQVPADVVVAGTPIDLRRVVDVDVPIVRARYDLVEHEPGTLAGLLREVLDGSNTP